MERCNMNDKIKLTSVFLNIILFIIIIILTILLLNNKNQADKEIHKKNVELNKLTTSKSNDTSNFKKLKNNENVVFFGDSITEIYQIENIYDDYRIIKSGVSGYKTTDLLKNINKMVYRYNPTKVILLIGTNDIGNDASNEMQNKTVNNKKISTDIKKNRPNTKLYVESIYPVNKNKNSSLVAKRNNDAIKNMNKKIKEYCKKNNITYIDMFDQLKDNDGNFNEKYTDDGLHPNTLGYAKITRILTPYIYE